ncbi:MAG: hypothetical protein U5L95_03685 [Candidatus Saccharibacteria bacterium]|nr:hypothetical protein [Candidatus Saccharibacteria bacterium]
MEIKYLHIDAVTTDFHKPATFLLARLAVNDDTISVQPTCHGEGFTLPGRAYNIELDMHVTPEQVEPYLVALSGIRSSVLHFSDFHTDDDCPFKEVDEIPFGPPTQYDKHGRTLKSTN